MDPLAQTISLLKPEALLWKQLEARGDWGVRFPANSGVVFSMVASGRCVFQTAGREPQTLREGDFLLLAQPPVWSLGRDAGSTPRDFDPAKIDPEARLTRIGEGDGPATRILGGRFVFDESNAALLKGVLPTPVEIRSAEGGALRLRRVLDLLGEEAQSDHPGRDFVLERLLELMLIEVVRTRPSAPRSAFTPGLPAGLADPRIAVALRAMHADLRAEWTVGSAASLAGMSRSVFADRFSRTVGVAPMEYLTRWRMSVARDALRQGRLRLAEVATRSGYRSVSAFSTAFTRSVGCPPSTFAARAGEVGLGSPGET